MLSKPETGLPYPRVQADIADQFLRTGKAAHIADCRYETGGDDQIDARDREQPLDRRILASCLCDLRIENPQILAQPIELRRCRSIAAHSSSGMSCCASQIRPSRPNRSACGQGGIR
jgi:hypothetical protein